MIFEGDQADFENPIQIINNAPPNSWIYLTQLSPRRVSPANERYRKARDERIAREDCNFRRVIVISNEEDLHELNEHLNLFDSVKNYEIRVFKGRCLTTQEEEPRFNALIVPPVKSHFGFSNQGSVASYPGSLCINDEKITEHLLKWFDGLWVISRPIKATGGIDLPFLKELQEQLQKRDTHDVVTYRKRVTSYESMLHALENARESVDIVSYVNLSSADDLRNRFYSSLRRQLRKGIFLIKGSSGT